MLKLLCLISFSRLLLLRSQIGKRVEVVKTLLMDAITECRYRAPSLTLLDDLDTLCHRGASQELGYAEENYLTRYVRLNLI